MDLTVKQKVQVDSVIVNRELAHYDKFKAVNAVILT